MEKIELTFRNEEQQALYERLQDVNKAFYVYLINHNDIADVYLFEQDGCVRAEIDTYTDDGIEMLVTTNEELSTGDVNEYLRYFDVDENVQLHYNVENRPSYFTLRVLLDNFENWQEDMKKIMSDYEDVEDDYIGWVTSQSVK